MLKNINKFTRTLFLFVLIFALLATTVFAASIKSTDETQTLPVKNSTIVTLGDSVTAFGGWQDVITQECGATVINSGTGGTGITNGLDQFQAKVADYAPDFCTIMYGFNDVAYSKEKFKTYIEDAIKRCFAIDVIPVLITQHDANEEIWYTKYPDRVYHDDLTINGVMDEFADAERELAQEYNVNLIDWNEYSKTLDVTVILNGGNDGVHLSDNGKEELGNFAADYFNTNFPGDANEAVRTTKVHPLTQTIYDFSEPSVPDTVYQNGLATDYTFDISDEVSSGNNALKLTTSVNSNGGMRFSFNSMPEKCIGLRFKIYTPGTNLRIIGFNNNTGVDSASRILDISNFEIYSKRVWTTCDILFDNYTFSSGMTKDDLKSITVLTNLYGAGYLVYYDDIQWLIENDGTTPIPTSSTTQKTSTSSTTVATTQPTSTTTKATTVATTTTTVPSITDVALNETKGVTYSSLSSAISAASSEDNLKLLQDTTVTSAISFSKSINLDLGSHTITSTVSRLFEVTANSNATFNVKNGTILCTSATTDAAIIVRGTNDLLLDNVDISVVNNGSNIGVVGALSFSAVDPTNITIKNSSISTKGFAIGDNATSDNSNAWNLYIYNSDISSSRAGGSVILKRDNKKLYDCIIYSGHLTSKAYSSGHYPSLTIAESSYMTTTENGGIETATTDFTAEFYVYDNSKTMFSVSVDGVETQVEENAEYTLPLLSTNGVAYTDGSDYYNSGDKIIVNSNMSFITVELDMSMILGASMRYNEVSGIRFYTCLNTTTVQNLREAGVEVSLGTIIAPSNLLGGEELTLNTPSENMRVVSYTSDKWFTQNDFCGVVGSIANVKDGNVKRDFVGRGFANVSINGVSKTVYASYYEDDVLNNTRQIGWIASQVKLGSEYGTLTQLQKDIVDKYYNLYIK